MGKQESRQVTIWFIAIIALLILWGSLIAWGALRTQSEFDIRKPAIILGSIATFVIIWALLLKLRARKMSD